MALLSAAALLGPALRVALARRAAPPLPPPAPPLPGEEVTALLPVRDEEVNVLPCLDGLLAQTAQPRVRVIDDGSTDATAALVLERLPAQGRLALLSAGPLPAGWRGKVNALAVGVEGVLTPWLLLTDADTRHHPELLARSLAASRGMAGGPPLAAVSLAGSQEVRGLAETLLTPAVFALLDLLLGDWRAAARGEGPPVANGQFILVRREIWEACGGFATVKAETLDDLALAVRLRAHGHPTAFLRARGLLRVRMYRGTREVARGWRRNLGGLFGTRPGFAAKVLGFLLLPPLVLLAEIAAGHPTAAALLWAAGAAASALSRTGGDGSPAWGLLYPLDSLFFAGVLAAGVADRRRGKLASWKGRKIEV